MLKIKPLKNRILVKLDRSPEIVAGGIEIARAPDKQGDWPYFPKRGTVLSVGPDVEDLCVGDYVHCTKYNGVILSERIMGERDLMLIREEFVLLVDENEKPSDVMFGRSREFWPGKREGDFKWDERRGVKKTW